MHGVRESGRNAQAFCKQILSELPEWFGVPEAIDSYAEGVGACVVFEFATEDTIAGFIALRPVSTPEIEVYVLAVRRAYQRRGVGRELIERAVRWSRERGAAALTVKTVGPSHPSEAYRGTRRFYEALGFVPIEERADVWRTAPCLLMIRNLVAMP